MDAHSRGIRTWISVEPVIDPRQAIGVIDACSGFVDHFKVGKINHWPGLEKKVDWVKFRGDAIDFLNRLGVDYYIKKA